MFRSIINTIVSRDQTIYWKFNFLSGEDNCHLNKQPDIRTILLLKQSVNPLLLK